MSTDIILIVKNLSKQYRLGTVSTGTISHDLNRFWAKIRGIEDPYLKIGVVNKLSTKGASEYIWALKDVNFEVKRGEILGIIGKNGAGKSTLLKILSKVTGPTTGAIKSNGRIASLLEVGTGFHPEMTGKENVFLNGAILGMTKKEIATKLDEIITFSGCERYINTPVKRYSSGMKVRLAFAVAAHLEPDILIIDEVLAVGDAEFQKKAIGKMQAISNTGGRTVLFVSHDMEAILKLTSRVLLLENGTVLDAGAPQDMINKYISVNFKPRINNCWETGNEIGNNYAKLKAIAVTNAADVPQFEYDVTENIYIQITYFDLNKEYQNTAIIHITDAHNRVLFASNEFDAAQWSKYHNSEDAIISTKCTIPGNLLLMGKYKVLIAIGNYNPNMVHVRVEDALTFSVIDKPDMTKHIKEVGANWPGFIRPRLDWEIKTNSV
ncbi:MAG: lipopolysaccharide transport system ATP-binding protein [Psychroserpens sp.]|jgi:lipopolysaccharide transport system ATP-binding protein